MLILRISNKLTSLAHRLRLSTMKHWLDYHWENDYFEKWINHKCLTNEQKAEIRDYWEPYFDKENLHYSDVYHDFYTQKTGMYDVRYVPDGLYYACIDRYFNNWDDATVIDNKCFYDKFFKSCIPSFASRLNNTWIVDGLISNLDIVVGKIISRGGEVVIKQATESEGGHGVYFINGTSEKEIIKIISSIKGDIVVQDAFKQDAIISELNETSINTIRIITLIFRNSVIPLSAIIRMGVNGSRVYNASSGGITCGIDNQGCLKKYAYYANGEKTDVHPTSNVVFNGYRIPGFVEAVELVKKEHINMAKFRLISWDVAIDENSKPVLIEANLKYGELDFHQLNNGPLFGDRTEDILGDIFGTEK